MQIHEGLYVAVFMCERGWQDHHTPRVCKGDINNKINKSNLDKNTIGIQRHMSERLNFGIL